MSNATVTRTALAVTSVLACNTNATTPVAMVSDHTSAISAKNVVVKSNEIKGQENKIVVEYGVFPVVVDPSTSLSFLLCKNLLLVPNTPSIGEATLEDWGIIVQLSSGWQEKMLQKMAKTFIMLKATAESQNLSVDDAVRWRKIVTYIDYHKFCIDDASPMYMEGILISCDNKSDTVVVRWNDDKEETLSGMSNKFYLVDIGEMFSAMVKINKDGSAVHMETVRPLGNTEAASAELAALWERLSQ
jgi:hypothetical protein